MKKLYSFLVAGLMLISAMPNTFAATTVSQDLQKVVENSFSEAYIQSTQDLNLSWGDSFFKTISASQMDNFRAETETDLNLKIDTSKFPVDWGIDNFSGNLKMKINMHVDTENQNMYLRVSNLVWESEVKDQSIKDILDGIAEIIKIYTEKDWKINFNQLVSFIQNIDPEAGASLNIPLNFNTSKKDAIKLYQGILASNLFKVTKSANLYELTLNPEVEEMDLTKLIQAFLEMEQNKNNPVLQDLNAEDLSSSIKMGLLMGMQFIDLKVGIETTNDKIQNMKMEMGIDADQIYKMQDPSFSGNLPVFQFVTNSQMHYDAKLVAVFKENPAQTIDINKIISMFKGIMKKTFAQKSEMPAMDWEENENTLPVGYNLEVPDTWYKEAYVFLSEQGVYLDYDQASKKISYGEFQSILKDLGYETDNVQAQREKLKISKYRAIKMMAKSMFEIEEAPLQYFLDQKIVSPSSPQELNGKMLNHAEAWMMIMRAEKLKK
ncbi:MAG TPA: hypothetical protein PLQ36_01650 [Candidatus Gracilibacteria bacterium]|nr:hypothetical protein [Candidatus Gracilibacteria bacterium]